jgi:hypothetical protein
VRDRSAIEEEGRLNNSCNCNDDGFKERLSLTPRLEWLQSGLRSSFRHLGLFGNDPGWIAMSSARLGIDGHERSKRRQGEEWR